MRDWQVISRTVKNARIVGVRSSQYHKGGNSELKKEPFLLVGRMRLWLPGWWVSWLKCCASRTCWRSALWDPGGVAHRKVPQLCWGSCWSLPAGEVIHIGKQTLELPQAVENGRVKHIRPQKRKVSSFCSGPLVPSIDKAQHHASWQRRNIYRVQLQFCKAGKQ